jgi:hypothetical protein
MGNHRNVGLALLAGALLTFVWMLKCPKISIAGQVYTQTVTEEGSSTHYDRGKHLDPTYFLPGLLVIWTGVAGLGLVLSSLDFAAMRARSAYLYEDPGLPSPKSQDQY